MLVFIPSRTHLLPVIYDGIYIYIHTYGSASASRSVVSNSLGPMDCSLPGSSVHGILQARILESVAIPFSRGSSDPRGIQPRVSCIAGRLFTIWATREAPYIQTHTHIYLIFLSFIFLFNFLAMPHGMRDPISLTRDWTHTLLRFLLPRWLSYWSSPGGWSGGYNLLPFLPIPPPPSSLLSPLLLILLLLECQRSPQLHILNGKPP